ncbi:hypothetical protein K7472_30625 [Streptomyces sp. PTM05]|uniref:Uncharacterized protein n=1 Tax=Streptantibioticus parmotrematis TaxID=2873249 RepID=A0ABS7R124_9ACTN|nr:hypothetical protein [Streptantibioticus parmotrematis]MBY8889168.1 hypothetical protein [Streptantibioticus parmotrematis]
MAEVDSVVVVRDSRAVEDALRAALEDAAPDERAGLERAVDVVARRAALPDADVRKEWVRDVLARRGVAVTDKIPAVKALRQAMPALTLVQAVQLYNEAAA